MLQQYPKRLIEVDLPIKRISAHARREKSIRHGHISTLHIWWARRPLAVCRAVLCAALWPDPADAECPVKFREDAIRLIGGFATKATSDKILKEHCSKEAWDKWQAFVKMGRSLDAKNPDHCNILRFALLDFIADFSDWDNSTVFEYLETARALTQSAHEALGGQPGTRPLVVDPFAGGGAIPLEALRVGADAFASDLNPLPILLNKVALEYVPRYGARLSEQVKQSAEQLRDGLQSNLKSYYFTEPKAENRVVFFWARCITCEGPGCGRVFPLIRSLWLRQKSTNGTAFRLKKGLRSQDVDVEIVTKVSASSVGQGTSRQGAATCPVCGYTTPVESVRRQLSQRRGGAADAKLLAVAYTRPGEIGKSYRLPTPDELRCVEKSHEDFLAERTRTEDGISSIPTEELNHLRGFFNVVLYGMTTWGDLFSPRQALLMVSLTRLIRAEHARLATGDPEFANAVATCLALLIGKVAQYNSIRQKNLWVSGGSGSFPSE